MTRAEWAAALTGLLGDGRACLGAPVLLPATGGIPQAYALARVLEHGAMTRDQLLSCTRWDAAELDGCIDRLKGLGMVRRIPFGFPGLQMFEAVL